MNDLTVVQANELVEASYSLSINEMRLIALACTKFNSKFDPAEKVGVIRIDINEFINAYGVENKNIYSELRDAVRSVMRKPIKLYNEQTEMFEEYAWLTKNAYSKTDGSHVLMQFSPAIEPYLFELKKRFTSINFRYAAKLNTPFSFRLYQWLYKAKNLNGSRAGDVVTVQLEIDWMKSQAALNGSYDRWEAFNRKVLTPAIERINVNTDLSVIYEPIKTGRKVTAVRFNYVVETEPTISKPLRPRLARRPKVIKGSHDEGVWMRKNLALLLDYEVRLKEYDAEAKLSLPDLRKMAEYAVIVDLGLNERLSNEIMQRENNKPTKCMTV